MAKVRPCLYFEVYSIFKAWEHIAADTFNKKVYFNDLFSLFIDELSILYIDWTYKMSDPSDISLLFVLKECNTRVHLFVNDHCQFKLEFVRKLIHELQSILLFLAVIILDAPCQSVEEINVQWIIVLYHVQRGYLLLQKGLFRIEIRHDRRKGASRKREGNHSDYH